MQSWKLSIGALPDASGTRFRVWAADASHVEVLCFYDDGTQSSHALSAEGEGYFSAHVNGVAAGTRYLYRVDLGDPRPDPASRSQPESVHSASCVVDPSRFIWSDLEWRGLPLEDLIIYEVHVGTATAEGTFDALIDRLDDLVELGITAIELMPVADFPGGRNWGYDGVCLFAPARAYGGAEGLRSLVDAAHARGLAVLLDVVYNHFGPDGNYLRTYSRAYFTDRYHTPWGDAVNLDGPDSRPVRDFFIANACHWLHEYHIDGLRLDATHALHDQTEPHFLAELVTRVRETLPDGRHFVIIAENETNNPNLLRPQGGGGYGLDAVWADDFHHQIRVALAGDCDGYYVDYAGTIEEIAETLRHGWFYTGQHSNFLNRPRGAPADDIPPPCFVHCLQNHDQVGNRATGERLHHQIASDAYRAASVVFLFSPYTPLIFQGQEWAATTPFLYFTHHHEELGRLVTEGRRAEFASFTAFSGAEVPDPQALDTFMRSKLQPQEATQPPHDGIRALYRAMLDLRSHHPALRERSRDHMAVETIGTQTLVMRRWSNAAESTLLLIAHLGHTPVQLVLQAHEVTRPPDGRCWSVLFDSEAPAYSGHQEASPFLVDCPATFEMVELQCARAVVLHVAPLPS